MEHYRIVNQQQFFNLFIKIGFVQNNFVCHQYFFEFLRYIQPAIYLVILPITIKSWSRTYLLIFALIGARIIILIYCRQSNFRINFMQLSFLRNFLLLFNDWTSVNNDTAKRKLERLGIQTSTS